MRSNLKNRRIYLGYFLKIAALCPRSFLAYLDDMSRDSLRDALHFPEK